MGLAETDDHIGSTSDPAVGFPEHGYGLTDSRCGAQVDPQQSACHALILACPLLGRQPGCSHRTNLRVSTRQGLG